MTQNMKGLIFDKKSGTCLEPVNEYSKEKFISR